VEEAGMTNRAAPRDPTPLLAPGAITDVAGLSVGHAAMAGRPTGCSVVLCPQGATAGVAVRGGAPGTRETDLLRPENSVQQVHAVLLTGGSAFGLAAAGGVVRWLEERGHGLPVGPARVPIVPAAVLFDLWLGDARIRPDEDCGHRACVAASASAPAQGNVGAGLGAVVGKLGGLGRAMKGGIGTASLTAQGVTVGALVAVNAIGDVLGADGQVLAGLRSADGAGLSRSLDHVLGGAARSAIAAEATAAGTATTIGIVATDAVLDKAGATQLAALAHHGLSRSVEPIGPHDGDTLFALATGRCHSAAATPLLLGALAAEAVSRAIRNAVLSAHGLDGASTVALPAWCDL
jgi:L-aminopeptidase/D-esterase-like protein